MNRRISAVFLAMLLPSAAFAIDVKVDGIGQDGAIHKRHAKCIATIDGKSTKGENLRPAISWNAVKNAKSYAIVVSDPDVPADTRRANDEKVKIGKKDERQTFYHWVQFNIPADVTRIAGGPATIGYGVGAKNDVSKATGYDGPCPPWNDARIHHYHFRVVALDTAKLELEESALAIDAFEAINAHAIEDGEQVATFTLNPALRKGL